MVSAVASGCVPVRQVEVFHEVCANTQEYVMPADEFIREDQSTRAHAFVEKAVFDATSASLKHSAAVPTLAEIRERAEACRSCWCRSVVLVVVGVVVGGRCLGLGVGVCGVG